MKNVIILTRLGSTVFTNGENWMAPRISDNRPKLDAITFMDFTLDLFERYTLPSMMNQTNKNFTWVLLTDDKLPDEYMERLEGYKKLVPNIVIRKNNYKLVSYGLSYQQDYRPYLPKSGQCITARLDGDDIVHPTWIDYIILCSEKYESGVVYSERCIRMLLKEDGTIITDKQIKAHKKPLSVVGLIEPDVSEFKGPHITSHRFLGAYYDLLAINHPMFCRLRTMYSVAHVDMNTVIKWTNPDMLYNQFNLKHDLTCVLPNMKLHKRANINNVRNMGMRAQSDKRLHTDEGGQ